MSVRRVQYAGGTRFADYADFQLNYMNYRSGWLVPNTEVWVGDDRWMRINALGCKGEDLDPALGTIGFFGDSATFGMALDRRAADSWPFHVRIPGYQVLNAACEGHPFDRICARYLELSRKTELSTVVIGGTWHNLVYNEAGEDAWEAFFSQFGGARLLAVCTLTTSLIPEASKRGLDDLIHGRAGRQPFYGWGSWATDPASTRRAYEGVLRYNRFVRLYCRRTGAVLIDLFRAYRPAWYDDLPDMFLDPAHARPELYPALGSCAAAALATHLPAKGDAHDHADAPAATLPAGAIHSHDVNHNVYPLW